MQHSKQVNPQQEALLRQFAGIQHPQQQELVNAFLRGEKHFEEIIYDGLDQLLVIGPALTALAEQEAAARAELAREEEQMRENERVAGPVYQRAAPVAPAAPLAATDEAVPTSPTGTTPEGDEQASSGQPTGAVVDGTPDPDEFTGHDDDEEPDYQLSEDAQGQDFEVEEY